MKKAWIGALALCLLLAGCGGGAQPAPDTTAGTSVSASPPAPGATAETSVSVSPSVPGAAAGTTAAVNPELSVLFINVGYGDAILIQTGGKNYMVDTGAKGAFISLYRALSLLGVNGLDGVFLTHTHADHIGGMEALSRRCGIGALYSAEISMDKDDGKNAIDQLAGELGLEQVKLRAGDTVDIGSGAYFEVLGPLETNSEDDNDNSLVMKLHAGGITVLLAGDMQFAEEQTLLDAGADLSADVLKVGNHGNPDATSEAFAKAVGADYAVISTSAAQEPDTPADSVIAALGSARIAVTQDDACGVLLGATGGAVVFYDPAIPAAAADIAIAQIDTEAQTVSLVNNGGDADISGYFIVSEKGNEVFVFPQGAALAAGETITVACTGGTGDYIWDDKKVWSGKDSEAGALYDAYGNALSRMQPSRLHNIWVRP